ncbi:MAG: nuclear transport factor 2 family protein [Kangiellaceae bacterium]|nr:nuclear transport factor 2 family protein [Kangiellaceae bacterium]
MIEKWHQLVSSRNPEGLNALLSDNVVLHSPVVHTPVQGKQMVSLYLHAAFHTFLTDSFTYVRELNSEFDHVLEFQAEIDGLIVNGVDMIRFDSNGQIVDFKVMVRPLKAMNLIHQKMGMMLEKLKPS